MTVVVSRPAPPLDGLITAITYRSGQQPRTSIEKILPGPGTGLWVNLNRDAYRSFGPAVREVPGAMVSGPTGRASVIEFEEGHAHVAVTFALGAPSLFFAPPVAELRDDLVPLEALCGRSGACLRERLLEAATPVAALAVMEDFLLSLLRLAPDRPDRLGPGRLGPDRLGPDPAVRAAAGVLSRGVPVGEVARALGLLPRTLRRRFTAQVGLTPKRFARVQRLQRLVRALDGATEVDWAAAAARHGYADQPHLAGEFRELVGVTPTGYLRSRVNGPNHLRFPGGNLCSRTRSWGRAAPMTSGGRKCRSLRPTAA